MRSARNDYYVTLSFVREQVSSDSNKCDGKCDNSRFLASQNLSHAERIEALFAVTLGNDKIRNSIDFPRVNRIIIHQTHFYQLKVEFQWADQWVNHSPTYLHRSKCRIARESIEWVKVSSEHWAQDGNGEWKKIYTLCSLCETEWIIQIHLYGRNCELIRRSSHWKRIHRNKYKKSRHIDSAHLHFHSWR